MYRDAEEELKRLEEALLEEDGRPEKADADQWDIDIDDAVSDIPDLPETNKQSKMILWLTAIIIALTAFIVGGLIYLFVHYRGVLL